MTVTLTTLGSRGVTVDVAPSALPEDTGPGGVQITLGLPDGPLTLQLTHDQAMAVWEELRAPLIRYDASS